MRTRLGFENVALHFQDVVGLFLVTSLHERTFAFRILLLIFNIFQANPRVQVFFIGP